MPGRRLRGASWPSWPSTARTWCSRRRAWPGWTRSTASSIARCARRSSPTSTACSPSTPAPRTPGTWCASWASGGRRAGPGRARRATSATRASRTGGERLPAFSVQLDPPPAGDPAFGTRWPRLRPSGTAAPGSRWRATSSPRWRGSGGARQATDGQHQAGKRRDGAPRSSRGSHRPARRPSRSEHGTITDRPESPVRPTCSARSRTSREQCENGAGRSASRTPGPRSDWRGGVGVMSERLVLGRRGCRAGSANAGGPTASCGCSSACRCCRRRSSRRWTASTGRPAIYRRLARLAASGLLTEHPPAAPNGRSRRASTI